MIDRSLFTNGIHSDLPVGLTPTCSVPTEQMARLLCDLLKTNGKVLEIGTGSGYNTAFLAQTSSEVVSVEAHPMDGVAEKLPPNVTLISGDGCCLDTGETFDGILVTFAAPRIMHVWFKQLREGGRLVVPIQVGSCCRVCVYVKEKNAMKLDSVNFYAHFTPMVQ